MVTVLSIVKDALIKMGADGLYNEDGECGCFIEDICPGEIGLECVPAKFMSPSNPDSNKDTLDEYPDGYFVPME